jgi:DNA mismatch endonuclease (patch repair protein)
LERTQIARLISPPASSRSARRTMQANRRTNTTPERLLRSELHRRGMRFRKDLRLALDGGFVRPDIVFTRHRVAVFVDGCFWHCCPEHLAPPKSNVDYWEAKLAGNVARDRRNDSRLRAAGWRVIRIWEHESPDGAADRVVAALRSRE